MRAEGRVTFPACFTLVAAMNPCPCGFAGTGALKDCTCTDAVIARYHARIGGPLLDRIDLSLRIERLDPERLLQAHDGPDTATVRERVVQARVFAQGRATHPVRHLSGAELLAACHLPADARRAVTTCARLFGLSGRGVTRLLRVARTIADLESSDGVTAVHVQEAASYRAAIR